jgi:hypothetical protein
MGKFVEHLVNSNLHISSQLFKSRNLFRLKLRHAVISETKTVSESAIANQLHIPVFPHYNSPTAERPPPHLSDPRDSSVAVGKRNIGPTPQVTLAASFGEKKADRVVSPRPVILPSPPV